MNTVVPVVVVIRHGAIPATILIFDCRVIPTIASVGAADDHVLACKACGPYFGRANKSDTALDCFRTVRSLCSGRWWFVWKVFDARVAFDAADFRACSETQYHIAVALHPDEIDNVVRAILHPVGLQPIHQWLLRL